MQELSGASVARYDRLVYGLHLDHIRHRAGQHPPPAAPADGYSGLFCITIFVACRKRSCAGVQGPGPLYCLPAYMILSGIWDFIKRGRGIAPDLTGRHPVGIYRATRGDSPVGCPLSLSAGATLPRLGVYARSLPASPAGDTRSLTGSRRCPRSMTPDTGAARPRLG